MKEIRIRFDGPSGPVGPRFIEAEDEQGRGICIGHWEPDSESTDWFLVLSQQEKKDFRLWDESRA